MRWWPWLLLLLLLPAAAPAAAGAAATSAEPAAAQPGCAADAFRGPERGGPEESGAGEATECGREYVVTSSRVVAIADIHGDLEQLERALRAAELLGEPGGRWAGGTAVLVQTGDVVDRGPDSLAIYRLLANLEAQAREAGGCVVQLLGNHEVLNMAGEFQYGSADETANFGGVQGRAAAFSPGHWLGDRLRALPLVARVVQRVSPSERFTTVFSHAGMPPGLAEQTSLEDLNREIREMLTGATPQQVRRFAYTNKALLGQGPLWTRIFAQPDEASVCRVLRRSLKAMAGDRMIVGHTVQEAGRPSVRCGGQLVLADTGMSRVYGGGLSLVQLAAAPGSPIELFDP
jgi:hypothetical protein